MTFNDITAPILGGATDVLTGIGEGIVDFFESIFLTTDGTISTMGTYLLVFVGIGMSIGVMRWVRKKTT